MKRRISIHGGHSRDFCSHARDPLEDIIQTYLKRGFSEVGIVEHMPPSDDRYLYPEEKEAGLTAARMEVRFARFVEDVASLREKYRSRIRIHFGFETEAYPGALEYARELREKYRPDYIVGSVHHVGETPIDYDRKQYLRAEKESGGRDNLYQRYFQRQYELLNELRPEVVGHFDLIRKYDSDYSRRLRHPPIRELVERNLELIGKLDLIMELNLRSWFRGGEEPYPTRSILVQARRLGITVIPADDSHEAESAGRDVERGIELLDEIGFRPPRSRLLK